MTKFKVGDKVTIREWDDMAKEFGVSPSGFIRTSPRFASEMKKYCGTVLTVREVCNDGSFRTEEAINTSGHYRWYFNDSMVESSNKNTIVIYRKDNKVIALDKVTGKTAEAICDPDDEFDFYVGADLAFERLRGRKPAPKTREETPKYFTGEMVCIKSASKYYTLGKIYKVKNGQWKDNDGDMNTIRYESIEHINRNYDSQFIEVVR